jgi:hypothetical protein
MQISLRDQAQGHPSLYPDHWWRAPPNNKSSLLAFGREQVDNSFWQHLGLLHTYMHNKPPHFRIATRLQFKFMLQLPEQLQQITHNYNFLVVGIFIYNDCSAQLQHNCII